MARPLAHGQLKLGQLLADRVRHAHHEIRVAAARGCQPPPAQLSRADRDSANVGDRHAASIPGGMRGHLPPHGHGPASSHLRIRPRKGSARAVGAPAAITRYQYAMALPSQGVQCAPQAAAKGTASGGRRCPQRRIPR